MWFQSFIEELRRRNVFRVATAYAIAGWLIIQVITAINEPLGLPGWFDTSVIVLVFTGFPIVLIIAWAFEVTSDGIKKTKEVDLNRSVTQKTGKKLNRIIITSLSLALLFVLVERVFFAQMGVRIMSDQDSTKSASIAVLPFVNMSSDQDNEYFSDGLSEEVLNSLAKVQDLKVAARTSSFKFKGLNENLSVIGEELKVDNILEGSVRKSGNTVRITAQLIQVSDGYHLWSETFDRELSAANLFDIQTEISNRVMEELKVRLLPEEQASIARKMTNNLEALNFYLEANRIMLSPEISTINNAIPFYERAIELDPGFAEAYARLARAHQLLYSYGTASFDETKEIVRETIDKALLIDGNNGLAYLALGRYYLFLDEDELALETFKRANQLLPNDPEVYDGWHLALEANGRYEDGKVIQEKAYELDPLNPDVAAHYANHLSDDDIYAALKILDETIERYPDHTYSLETKSHMLLQKPLADFAGSFAVQYRAMQKKPENIDLLEGMIATSREVDMQDYAGVLVKKLSELYPEASASLDARIDQAFYEEDHDLVIELIQQKLENTGESALIPLLSYTYQKTGQTDKAVKTMEIIIEEKFGDSFSISGFRDLRLFANYGALLYKNGDLQSYQEVKNLVCAYYESQDPDTFESNDDMWLKANSELLCRSLELNTSRAVAIMDSLYFQDNDKIHSIIKYENNAFMSLLKEEDEFKSHKQKIFNDLHSMGSRAVANLKESGEWEDIRLLEQR